MGSDASLCSIDLLACGGHGERRRGKLCDFEFRPFPVSRDPSVSSFYRGGKQFASSVVKCAREGDYKETSKRGFRVKKPVGPPFSDLDNPGCSVSDSLTGFEQPLCGSRFANLYENRRGAYPPGCNDWDDLDLCPTTGPAMEI